MALSREDAKGAIVQRDQDDADLEQTLEEGHKLQLHLAREGNRHQEAMRSIFGKVFGDGDNVALYIAFTGMSFGIAAYFCCLLAAAKLEDNVVQFWMQQGERALAFAGACLAYIFGKGSKQD